MFAIKTEGLCKAYGGAVAVKDVNIEIAEGSITGLVGKNGAGKTTLIKLLAGITNPTTGRVCVLPNGRTAGSVAALVESPALYETLTAQQNLEAQCLLLGIAPDREYLHKTLQLVGLQDTPKKVKFFSLGMKQRLALAVALVGKPSLLLLDEPTNGLDPQGIHDVRQLLLQINAATGATIVVSSHLLTELSKLAQTFLFMDKGSIVATATAEQLQSLNLRRTRIVFADASEAQKALPLLSEFGETGVMGAIAEVQTQAPLTQILLVLAQQGAKVTGVSESTDGLEEYFLRLVGGNK